MEKKIEIKNRWALICGQTSIDKNSNQISLFNIIDEVTIFPIDKSKPLPTLPVEGITVPLAHDFVTLWTRDLSINDKELKVAANIRLFDQKGEIIHEQPVEMRFEAKKSSLRFVVKNNGLKAKISGEYRYEIEIIDPKIVSVKAVAPFTVKFS